MPEDICPGKLALLALRALVVIGRQRRDIDERGDARIGPGMGDERAAIGVPDKDNWPRHPTEARLHGGNVGRNRVEAVLGSHDFMALGLKGRDQSAET